MEGFKVKDSVLFNGTLYKSSYGEGKGKRLNNYKAYIVRIIPGRTYPILLGDNYSNQLGWVKTNDIVKN